MEKQAMLQLFRQFCEIISEVHIRGVFHFDLKPEHLVVNGAGEPFVIDFGSAQIVEHKTALQNGDSQLQLFVVDQVAGSPLFCPQNDAGQDFIVCDKQDVYALGCVLFKVLTRQFCTKAINKASRGFQLLYNMQGQQIAYLLAGMLTSNQFERFSIDEVLSNQVFLCDNTEERYIQSKTSSIDDSWQ
jgi:serine/threonine protein kinase